MGRVGVDASPRMRCPNRARVLAGATPGLGERAAYPSIIAAANGGCFGSAEGCRTNKSALRRQWWWFDQGPRPESPNKRDVQHRKSPVIDAGPSRRRSRVGGNTRVCAPPHSTPAPAAASIIREPSAPQLLIKSASTCSPQSYRNENSFEHFSPCSPADRRCLGNSSSTKGA